MHYRLLLPTMMESDGSIASIPVDDVLQGPAIEIGAQIVAEEVDGTVPILIAGTRDVRRDQNLGIGPQPRHRRVFEFTDIDIERSAPQGVARQCVCQPR